jgi:hypothetical protein
MDSPRRVGITRRRVMQVSLATLAVALCPKPLQAETEAEKRLKKYRSKLFGRWPILRDGDLEELDYRLYEKDEHEFERGVDDALDLINGKTLGLYVNADKNKARWLWRRDRSRTIKYLLNAINVPDYFIHRRIRNQLRKDGILDFDSHKLSIANDLERLIEDYKQSSGAEAILLEQAINQVPKAAEALEAIYLLTIPLYDIRGYREIDKKRGRVMKTAFEALENAQNIEEAWQTNNHVKAAHQTKELVLKLNKAFGILLEVQERALTYAKHATGLGHRYEKIYHIQDSDNYVVVFDYIAEEWDRLDFHRWRKDLEKKVEAVR